MIYESLLAYEDEGDFDDFGEEGDGDFDDFESEFFDSAVTFSARGPRPSLTTPPLGVPKAAEASEASKATAAPKMK